MGKFEARLPSVVLKDVMVLYNEAPEIFGEILEAGGKVVYNEIKTTAPVSFQSSDIMRCLKMTKVYRTPSDGAINIKIGFYGYFINRLGKWTPAPLVANIFEYGSSKFTKRPFFRKAFRLRLTTKVMLEKALELISQKTES